MMADSFETQEKKRQCGWRARCSDFTRCCLTCAHHRYPDRRTPYEPTRCNEHRFDTLVNAVCNEWDERP